MNEKYENKLVHEAFVGLGKRVQAIMEIAGTERRLTLVSHDKAKQEFSLPAWLTKTDLPVWLSAALRKGAPHLSLHDVKAYETNLRSWLPTQNKVVSVIVGQQEEIIAAPLFHFGRKNFTSVRRNSSVTIRAEIQQRYSPPEMRNWTFLLFTPSVDAAHELEWKILRTDHSLFCQGELITGIVAYNQERWESAGLSEADVIKLAGERNVRLRLVYRELKCNLGFRCE